MKRLNCSTWVFSLLIAAASTLSGLNRAEAQVREEQAALNVISLVNGHRASIGRPALAADPDLAEAAERYAQFLAATDPGPAGTLGHRNDGKTPGQRMAEAGYGAPGAFAAAENIYWMSPNNPNAPQAAVNWWLNSPAHRRNMEGAYQETGVGAYSNAGGRIYFCQVFANPPAFRGTGGSGGSGSGGSGGVGTGGSGGVGTGGSGGVGTGGSGGSGSGGSGGVGTGGSGGVGTGGSAGAGIRAVTVENQTGRTLRYFFHNPTHPWGPLFQSPRYFTLSPGQAHTHLIEVGNVSLGAADFRGVRMEGTVGVQYDQTHIARVFSGGGSLSPGGVSDEFYHVSWDIGGMSMGQLPGWPQTGQPNTGRSSRGPRGQDRDRGRGGRSHTPGGHNFSHHRR